MENTAISNIKSITTEAKILRCGCTGFIHNLRVFFKLNHKGKDCPNQQVIDLGTIISHTDK